MGLAGVAVGGVGFVGIRQARQVLVGQAALAREIIGTDPPDALGRNKTYRKRYPGPPVNVLLLGDSIAAGLGADSRSDTLGARVSKKLARAMHQRVRLRTLAVVGSETSDVLGQIENIPTDYRPDVVLLIVGGNDVTHRLPVEVSAGHLRECLERLRAWDAPIVVGLCPDLGAIRPVPQPLRSLAGRESRRLARAQCRTARAMGAHSISLGEVVGPLFIDDPQMFSSDQFHPSSLGYRRTATALVPSLLYAMGEGGSEPPPGHHPPTGPEDAEPVWWRRWSGRWVRRQPDSERTGNVLV